MSTKYAVPVVAPTGADTAVMPAPISVSTISVLIVAANLNRKGLILYNNSAKSLYIAYGAAANATTSVTAVIPTLTQYVMPSPIYTGAIYGIRTDGTSTVIVTELT